MATVALGTLAGCQLIAGLTERTEDSKKCLHNSDCDSGRVCIFQTCAKACAADIDCLAGDRCLVTSDVNACVSPAQSACANQEVCPVGTTCSAGMCRTSCSSDDGCRTDQTCLMDACVGTDGQHDRGGTGGMAGMGGLSGGMAGLGGMGGSGGQMGGAGTQLDSPCANPNQRNCDGPMSRQQVLCDSLSMTWRANGTCRADEYCDRSTGDCLPIIAQCAEQLPGDHVCLDEALHECGPDLVTTTLVDACAQATGECARCRPVVLAEMESGLTNLAVTDDSVYFTTGTAVTPTLRRVGLQANAGPAVTLAAGGRSGGGPYQIATRGEVAYWTNYSNGVQRIDSSGASSPVGTTSAGCCAGLTTYGDEVFLSNISSIEALPIAGGSSRTLITEASPQFGFSKLAVDEAGVYWAPPNRVLMVPLAGGAVTTLATGTWNMSVINPYPCSVVLGETHVYWAAPDSIYRVERGGGQAEAIVPNLEGVRGLAMDDNFLYWGVRSGVGAIMKVRREGGVSVVVASNQGGPADIAIDAENIYWTNESAGTVMRIAK